MAVEERYQADVTAILSHSRDNGGELWTTPDRRILKGGPFSTVECVQYLLEHWVIRRPIGPCHYGIGTLFLQVEYPFRNYNLFEYVYVLSFYRRARGDSRFREALAALEAETVDGQIVVERVVPKLANLAFCQKGAPSELATRRYRELLANLDP